MRIIFLDRDFVICRLVRITKPFSSYLISRASLTLAQKYETIDYHDKNRNALQKELIARFKIPQSILSKFYNANENLKLNNLQQEIVRIRRRKSRQSSSNLKKR